MAKRRRLNGATSQARMAKNLDNLARYEQFCEEILPDLRKELEKKTSAEDIYKKYAHLAAARAISIIATEKDSAKTVGLIKDVLDRTVGKPAERSEVTHKLDKVTDTELDAILKTSIQETEEKAKH